MPEDIAYEQPTEDFEESTSGDVAGDAEAVEAAASETAGQPDTPSAEPSAQDGPIPYSEVDWGSVDLTGIDRAKADELPPALAKWRSDMDRARQEAAHWRRLAESQPTQQQQPQVQAPSTGEPKRPPSDAPQEAWDAYVEARTEWLAEQKVKAAIDPIQQKLRQQEQQAYAQWFESQTAKIESDPAYTPEVGQAMAEIAQTAEGSSLLSSEAGLRMLFRLARSQVAESAATKRKLQRVTTAKERTVSRPSEGGSGGEAPIKGETAYDIFMEQYRRAVGG